MRRLYDRYLLPHLTHCVCSLGIFTRTRAALVPKAEGRVLEVGIGSGLNLGFYRPGRVTSVTGVDPSIGMTRRARRRAAAVPIPVDVIALELGEIRAASASFDTIVCTFTLCSPRPGSQARSNAASFPAEKPSGPAARPVLAAAAHRILPITSPSFPISSP